MIGVLSRLWQGFALALLAAQGKRRLGLAVLCGACISLALPPVYAFPALIPAFSGLLWLMHSARSSRAAFAVGWAFGAGFFITGTYWISIALLTDVSAFGWIIPLALFGLSGALGLFPALAVWLAYSVAQSPLARAFWLAAAWSALEYTRGVVLTGFPWNVVGSAWAVSDAALQSAAWLGVMGLGLFTVLLAALPAACTALASVDHDTTLARRIACVAYAALLALVLAGVWRLQHTEVTNVPDLRIRLVQGNVAQHHKWDPERQYEDALRHLRLSSQPVEPGQPPITHVIWSETALPYVLSEISPWRRILADHAPPGGAILTGALRVEGDERAYRIWNSLFAVTDKGEFAAVYDKHHLVPFGEFVPLRQWLPLPKITAGGTDFSRGPGPQTLRVPGLPPFSPLICYEVIFPWAVLNPQDRPEWLLTITNDAWFGRSSGPYQHAAAARFRAVEQGLPLLRAANTGISMAYDPLGRELGHIPLLTEGVLDVPLPRPIAPPFYARLGEAIPLTLLVLMALAGWFVNHRQRARQ